MLGDKVIRGGQETTPNKEQQARCTRSLAVLCLEDVCLEDVSCRGCVLFRGEVITKGQAPPPECAYSQGQIGWTRERLLYKK